MLSTRWEPFAGVNRLSRELDRVFGTFNPGATNSSLFRAYPQVSMWEDEENFYVEAELPGCSLEELELSVSGSQLTLKGERKSPQLEHGQWLRQERGFIKFNRTIELPSDVDSDHVSATLRNGVLLITLGKRAEVKPRKIEIQSK